VTRLRQGAEAQYAAGRGGQQDPIQADVELALLERERLTLAAREQIIVAQINGLLHRPAEGRLPAAPATLEPAAAPSRSAEQWQRYAQQHRPELHTAARIVDARASSMALAQRAYYPDFSFGVAYNSMWPQLEHQFMLGFSLNIPIQLGARRGGVNEATAALARAESLQAERRSAVNVEVRQAWVRFDEALAQIAVYRDQILPAARRQIEAAEAGYTSGRNSFSDIMSAQRQLRRFEQAYAEALADTWRRRAALTRAAGTASGQPAEGGVR
jgi:outer membrane protein TolC